MSKLKNSIIALAVLVILVGALAALMPLVGLGQKPSKFGRPGNYYLTKTTHNGAQALTACAAGYHMASMWEIYDPSNLRYNTFLGVTLADSGLGPPNRFGWIRSGEELNTSASGQPANCLAWKSADASEQGCSIGLGAWTQTFHIESWKRRDDSCNTNNHVWCVKD